MNCACSIQCEPDPYLMHYWVHDALQSSGADMIAISTVHSHPQLLIILCWDDLGNLLGKVGCSHVCSYASIPRVYATGYLQSGCRMAKQQCSEM